MPELSLRPSAARALHGFWNERDRSGWDAVNWQTDDITFGSGLPWLNLRMPWRVPFEEMLAEARGVRHLMVGHRENEGNGDYSHRGWRSICFHGLGATKTEHCSMYGLTDETAADQYTWTEIAPLCPVTTDFFKNTFSYTSYDRVRFMLLEPGGYILPHVDTDRKKLGPVNMALNNPVGCEFMMRGFGVVPFRPGSAFQLDVGNTHAVWNRSKEDRYHIIVHGHVDDAVWQPIYRRSFEAFRRSGQSGLKALAGRVWRKLF